MPTDESHLVVHRLHDVYVVEFVDRSILEQRNINQLEQELLDLCEQAGHPRLLISFAGVKTISSAVLGMLMSVNQKAKSMKGEVRLADIDSKLREVFTLTRLDSVLKIYESSPQALTGFGGN